LVHGVSFFGAIPRYFRFVRRGGKVNLCIAHSSLAPNGKAHARRSFRATMLLNLWHTLA
jgi:hypothetical protein